MASDKQIEYLTKLSKWKTQVLPVNVEQLSHADASALIDKWKALPSTHGDAVEAVAEQQAEKESKPERVITPFNAIQAGMAKNAVARHVLQAETQGVRYPADEVVGLIIKWYDLFEAADKELRALHQGGAQ